MEHNWTYIFQELSLLTFKPKEYDLAEATHLTKKANQEVFLPKAKTLGGEIIKQQDSRNLICFDKLKNAEEYISQMQHLLKDFKKEQSDFYFEHTSFIWAHNSRKLNTENMLFLKEISSLLSDKTGNYCSQKLDLESHRFGKIIVETNEFYICQLVYSPTKSATTQTSLRSVRVFILILIIGLVFITSRELVKKLNDQLNTNRYNNIEQSLDVNKPSFTYQILKKLEVHNKNQNLEDILYKYVKQEWDILLELPIGSSPKILKNRIESLLKTFPWSKNLSFFSQLLDLVSEFEQDEIPLSRLKSLFHNSSFANRNKVTILINFCSRYNLDPFFLSSELKKLNLKNADTLYLNFFESCLKNDIKGKELELIQWFKKLPHLEMKKHLESWMKNPIKPLNKNSFRLLVRMQELDPITAQKYIQKEIIRHSSPLEEIEMLVLIKDKSSREILLAYLEELVQDLKRRKLHPEVQKAAQSVLVRISE